MPAATNIAEITAAFELEWSKLNLLLDRVTPEIAGIQFEDETSVKDVVAHRAHWIDLFLGWFADGQAGREVHVPALGYKWSELKAYNTALRERESGLSWNEARAKLQAAHDRLADFYATHNDAQLYAPPMIGGNGKWTAGRYSESAGASHYRSAAKYIRACLRKSV